MTKTIKIFFLTSLISASVKADELCKIYFKHPKNGVSLKGDLLLTYSEVDKDKKLYFASSEWSRVDEPGTLQSKPDKLGFPGWKLNVNHRHTQIIRMEAVSHREGRPLKIEFKGSQPIAVFLANVKFFPNSWNDNTFKIVDLIYDPSKKEWSGKGSFIYSSWASVTLGEHPGDYETTTLSEACFR